MSAENGFRLPLTSTQSRRPSPLSKRLVGEVKIALFERCVKMLTNCVKNVTKVGVGVGAGAGAVTTMKSIGDDQKADTDGTARKNGRRKDTGKRDIIVAKERTRKGTTTGTITDTTRITATPGTTSELEKVREGSYI